MVDKVNKEAGDRSAVLREEVAERLVHQQNLHTVWWCQRRNRALLSRTCTQCGGVSAEKVHWWRMCALGRGCSSRT